MNATKSITLSTVPLPAIDLQAHPSRCLVALDTLAHLGLGLLDPVLVSLPSLSEEHGSVAAKLWLAPTAASTGAALSPDLLQSLGLCVGDKVTLSPLHPSPPPARSVTLQPPPGVSITGPALAYVRNHLIDLHLVSPNQFITLSLQGAPTTCRISLVTPSNRVVSFTASTTLSIASSSSSSTSSDPPKQAPATAAPVIPLAGLDATLSSLTSLLSASLFHHSTYTSLHLRPPRGVLLYGPPGTGKTLLARHLAHSTQAHFTLVNGPELVSKYYGETEQRLKALFESARVNAPAIVFVDEMDALCPKRDGQGSELEKRVVATLLTLLDGASAEGDTQAWDRVFVIGATNRPNAIDEAMRRPGRLDVEVEVGIPGPNERALILHAVLAQTSHAVSPAEVRALADKMHGYVGADVASVVREAGVRAVRRRVANPLSNLVISAADLGDAMQGIVPSAMRESVVQVPDVKWEDIGGNDHIKQALKESVEWPLKRANDFIRFGITPPKGILLYGPPGCSKTLVAKALANESQLNFLAVKGPELFSKWVGDSEKAIAQVFRKARAAAPSIIFFDEIDAIAGKRNSGESQSVTDRVLSQLLNEMDGVEPLVNVTIVAATNRPDLIDPALLRPGRIDRILYVGPPTQSARLEILRIQSRKMRLSPSINLASVAEELDGCSGAEVVSVCQAAALNALQRDRAAHQVEQVDFDKAVGGVARRITREMHEFYDGYRKGSRLVSIA
ncbi:P-loop containing nucleoside triphosphate hydrolase protein [Catenaria anguillulae PL171]|uniref:p-loop containing nucleoside triphosphate hydrolase protein n=1 Tax=Catenaria anguillulae PL171 TaxID=765915 RepID=A0A1Y2HPU6_9FUNG|nr:P-loop containing nucleoside triphosphate hydrolase protein [Catenaria anguillulae PL171]